MEEEEDNDYPENDNDNNQLNNFWDNKLEENASEKIKSLFEKAKNELDNILEEFTDNVIKDIKGIKATNQIKSKFNNLNKLPLIPKGNHELINSVLLCLCNIDIIRNFCICAEKEEIYQKMKKENNFFSNFVKFIEELWTVKGKDYKPIVITENLKRIMNGDYKTTNPGLIFENILTAIKDELNPVKLDLSGINNSYIKFDEQQSKYKFEKKIESNKSLIFKEFFSNMEIKFRCPTNVDIFIYEYSNIPVVNLYLKSANLQNISNEEKDIFNNINLKESFSALLTDQDTKKIECKICNEEQNYIVTKRLIKANKILIININRKNDEKRDVKLNYEFKYKSEIFWSDENNKNMEYELVGVIIKNNELGGALYTYFKYVQEKKWFVYDHSKVGNIQKVANEKEIIDPKNAIILIYENTSI